MTEVTIKTNGHHYPIIYGYELTEKERGEFDYYENVEDMESAMFFKYRGVVYDLNEFMRIDDKSAGDIFSQYDGYHGNSYFSGILVRYTNDGETIQVATYYS